MEWKKVRRGNVPDGFLEQMPKAVDMKSSKDVRDQDLEFSDDHILQLGFLQELEARRGTAGFFVNEFVAKCFAKRVVSVETKLGALSSTPERVREAFDTLYNVTSNIVHLAGVRFEGDFVVIPRPRDPLSVEHCLALATVVKHIGFDVKLDDLL